MRPLHSIGDLVHIPQSVRLVDVALDAGGPQLNIPLRVEETEAPTVGIITKPCAQDGYVRVYCQGETWAVKNDSIYGINKGEQK